MNSIKHLRLEESSLPFILLTQGAAYSKHDCACFQEILIYEISMRHRNVWNDWTGNEISEQDGVAQVNSSLKVFGEKWSPQKFQMF